MSSRKEKVIKEITHCVKVSFIYVLVLIVGMALFIFIPFILHAGEVNSAVEKQMKEATKLKKQIKINPEANKYYKQMQEEAFKSYQHFKQKQMPMINHYRQQYLYNHGYKVSAPIASYSPASTLEGWRHYLQDDEAIYIFMSSSVPFTTWDNYAASLDRLRETNAVMVLRGCIGGCQKIRPTIEFLQKIIIPGLDQVDFSSPDWQEVLKKKARHVQVWIDPLLFEQFGIKEVPCIVYTKGIKSLAGSLPGENANVKFWKVCGDWDLAYMLTQLQKKSGAEVLGEMVKDLSKSWYEK